MAGCSDIRVATSWPHHTKRLQLQARLGSDGVVALLDLWCYAGAHKANGNLRGMDADAVELAAGWKGKRGVLIATLKELRLLDGAPKRFKLHNWSVRQPYASGTESRSILASRAGKASAAKRKVVNAPLNSVERPVERPVQPLPPSLPPVPPTLPPESDTRARDRVPFSETVGIGLVAEAFARATGKLPVDRELREVREWVAAGTSPTRIAAALDAVTASPSVAPKNRWSCARALVRDTPPGAPMVWTERETAAPPGKAKAPVVNQRFRDLGRSAGYDFDREKDAPQPGARQFAPPQEDPT